MLSYYSTFNNTSRHFLAVLAMKERCQNLMYTVGEAIKLLVDKENGGIEGLKNPRSLLKAHNRIAVELINMNTSESFDDSSITELVEGLRTLLVVSRLLLLTNLTSIDMELKIWKDTCIQTERRCRVMIQALASRTKLKPSSFHILRECLDLNGAPDGAILIDCNEIFYVPGTLAFDEYLGTDNTLPPLEDDDEDIVIDFADLETQENELLDIAMESRTVKVDDSLTSSKKVEHDDHLSYLFDDLSFSENKFHNSHVTIEGWLLVLKSEDSNYSHERYFFQLLINGIIRCYSVSNEIFTTAKVFVLSPSSSCKVVLKPGELFQFALLDFFEASVTRKQGRFDPSRVVSPCSSISLSVDKETGGKFTDGINWVDALQKQFTRMKASFLSQHNLRNTFETEKEWQHSALKAASYFRKVI